MVDNTPPPNELDAIDDQPVAPVPSLVGPNVVDVLSSRRRRYVLYYLLDSSDGVTELDDLADQLQRWERAADDEVPDDHGVRIATALHHVDLPKLSDAGIVDFDPRSGAVRYHADDSHEAVLELIGAVGDG